MLDVTLVGSVGNFILLPHIASVTLIFKCGKVNSCVYCPLPPSAPLNYLNLYIVSIKEVIVYHGKLLILQQFFLRYLPILTMGPCVGCY